MPQRVKAGLEAKPHHLAEPVREINHEANFATNDGESERLEALD
jgi:hypothetical protein